MKNIISKKLAPFILTVIFLLSMPSTVFAIGGSTPTGIPMSEVGNRIDEIVAHYMHEFTPGLAVAIVHNGEIVFSRGYGYANIAQRIPIDPANTVFSYGSIGKLFVYVSVMQLVERGLINLDNDIHTYLPADLAQQFNFRYSFTMRDLLNHGAGFEEFNFNTMGNMELRQALLATQPRQIFQPNTAKAYSNFGVALAAYIVQYISGNTFADYERLNILEPLGMTNTKNQPHWYGNNTFLQDMAIGYQRDSGGEFNEVPSVSFTIYPAGALRGSAEDLAQLAMALMPPQNEPSPLFTYRSTLDLMLSPSYSRRLGGTHHGFISHDGLYPALGHAGGLLGFQTDFVIVPSQRFGIIALTNATGSVGIIEKIVDLLIGNTMDSAVPLVENLPDAESVTGTFVSLRRTEGNILEIMNIINGTHWTVEAVGENIITLNMMRGATNLTITYQQIAPYLFTAISYDSAVARNTARIMYEIYFVMENGQPIRISASGTMDSTRQTFGQSIVAFAGGMILYWGSVIFFIIMPIILLIMFLRKRGKENSVFLRLSTVLLLCGTLSSLNWIVYEVRFFSGIPIIKTATLIPHIWIGYILLALTVVVLVASVMFFIKCTVTKRRKVFYFATITALALHLFILWQWNYFEPLFCGLCRSDKL